MTVNKHLICWGLSALAMVVSHIGLYQYATKKGFEQGIRAYHQQCFDVGGIAMDEHGQAVVCGPLSKVPKEEEQSWKNKVNAPSLFS